MATKNSKKSVNLIAERMQRFVDHIFSSYDILYFFILWHPMTCLLPIGSDEIIKRVQMWLDNPHCGHKEGQKFPFVWWDNHQGESSHVHRYNFFLNTSMRPIWSKTVHNGPKRFQKGPKLSKIVQYGLIWSNMIHINLINYPNGSSITRSPGLVLRWSLL